MAPLYHLWERGRGRGLKTLQNCQFSPLPNPLPRGARGLIAFDRVLCEQHYVDDGLCCLWAVRAAKVNNTVARMKSGVMRRSGPGLHPGYGLNSSRFCSPLPFMGEGLGERAGAPRDCRFSLFRGEGIDGVRSSPPYFTGLWVIDSKNSQREILTLSRPSGTLSRKQERVIRWPLSGRFIQCAR